jgi:hypothetical protein
VSKDELAMVGYVDAKKRHDGLKEQQSLLKLAAYGITRLHEDKGVDEYRSLEAIIGDRLNVVNSDLHMAYTCMFRWMIQASNCDHADEEFDDLDHVAKML